MRNYYYIYLVFSFLLIGTSILLLSKKIPDVNYIIGFRTKLSTKNTKNWKFANRLYAKYTLILGIINIIVSLIFIILDNKINDATAENICKIVGVLTFSPVILVTLIVHYKLKKFDSKNSSDDNTKIG